MGSDPFILYSQTEYLWLCRVPETINEAKALVSTPAEELEWTEREGGYRTTNVLSRYGDRDQRWLLVYSEQAYQRESQTLEKTLNNQQALLEKTLWHLQNDTFQCAADAWQALESLTQRLHSNPGLALVIL